MNESRFSFRFRGPQGRKEMRREKNDGESLLADR